MAREPRWAVRIISSTHHPPARAQTTHHRTSYLVACALAGGPTCRVHRRRLNLSSRDAWAAPPIAASLLGSKAPRLCGDETHRGSVTMIDSKADEANVSAPVCGLRGGRVVLVLLPLLCCIAWLWRSPRVGPGSGPAWTDCGTCAAPAALWDRYMCIVLCVCAQCCLAFDLSDAGDPAPGFAGCVAVRLSAPVLLNRRHHALTPSTGNTPGRTLSSRATSP